MWQAKPDAAQAVGQDEAALPVEPDEEAEYTPSPAVAAWLETPWLDRTLRYDPESRLLIVSNPDDMLVVVNKQRNLPYDYEPADLVVPAVPFPFADPLPQRQMRREAARALEAMFEAALAEGIELYAVSGYRSYHRQAELFERYAAEHGEEAANRFSARPGQSEHQTGLAMDVSHRDVGFALTTDFAETPAGKWVAEHAWRFGYIIRYPEGKETFTGYQYEPWHLRYVGLPAAEAITRAQTVLEQYLSRPVPAD